MAHLQAIYNVVSQAISSAIATIYSRAKARARVGVQAMPISSVSTSFNRLPFNKAEASVPLVMEMLQHPKTRDALSWYPLSLDLA